MPVHLTCPQGHRWEPQASELTQETGQLNCPECGVTVPLSQARHEEPTQVSQVHPSPPGPSAAAASLVQERTQALVPAGEVPTVLPGVPGYEVLGTLGRGGMGVVYKARQNSLKRLVALKMILAAEHAGAQELLRFRTEAEAVARLQHPNIVQIHEIGEQDGRPYFSLEYVDGGSLAARLRGVPQPPRQAAQLVETLARAMHTAHQQGIVHRDLKPANILLASGGRQPPDGPASAGGARPPLALDQYTPKITDFGLAKFLNQQESLTATGEIVGTISYMAPEQAWGKSKVRIVSPAADVYALGAIFYEMLTGRPPFQGETLQDTLEQVWSQDPVPPRRLQPRVPFDLDTICLKALEKDPGKRYPTAQALADDLRRFLDGAPIKARPVGVLVHAWKWTWRHPTRAVALAAGLLLIAGLVLWLRSDQLRLEAEQLRLKAEQQAQLQAEARRARVLQGLSGMQGAVAAQLAAGRFQEAEQTLRVALKGLGDESVPARLRSKLEAQAQQLQRIVQFYRHADDAWFRAGQEEYGTARAASETALAHLGILDGRGQFAEREWWRHLPDEVLPPRQRLRLRRAIYRQLLLLIQLRATPGLARLKWTNLVGGLFGVRNPVTAAACRSALKVVAQAQALERAEGVQPAQTVRLFKKLLRDVLRQTAGPQAVSSDWADSDQPRGMVEPSNPTDFFFSGCVHYFIGKATRNNQALRLIAWTWSDNLDFRHPLATAEIHLLEAVRQDPRQYWTHFVLGRTLYLRGEYRGAQQAFTACVALREEYPVSYQLRGLAICRRALALPPREARLRDQLIRRALEDFQLADRWGGNDPVLFWARGELYVLLRRDRDALEAYARGLEAEDQLQQMVSRRNVLGDVEKYLADVSKRQPHNPDVQALRALVYLSRGETAAAAAAARRALKFQPGHVRALAIAGTVHLQQGTRMRDPAGKRAELTRALELFQKALKQAPANHLAAAGRPRAYEELGEYQKALAAFDYLLTIPHRGKAPVAATPAQKIQAHLGRYRVLVKLGRGEEARRARTAANRLDLGALPGSRPK